MLHQHLITPDLVKANQGLDFLISQGFTKDELLNLSDADWDIVFNILSN